jgi:hypothetical protein
VNCQCIEIEPSLGWILELLESGCRRDEASSGVEKIGALLGSKLCESRVRAETLGALSCARASFLSHAMLRVQGFFPPKLHFQIDKATTPPPPPSATSFIHYYTSGTIVCTSAPNLATADDLTTPWHYLRDRTSGTVSV